MTVSTCCSFARYGVGDRCPRCEFFARELAALNYNTNHEPPRFGNRAMRRKLQAQHRRDMRRNKRSSR